MIVRHSFPVPVELHIVFVINLRVPSFRCHHRTAALLPALPGTCQVNTQNLFLCEHRNEGTRGHALKTRVDERGERLEQGPMSMTQPNALCYQLPLGFLRRIPVAGPQTHQIPNSPKTSDPEGLRIGRDMLSCTSEATGGNATCTC